MENLVKQTEIAGMQSAGRVLPIWRGEYSDSAFYEQTDIVLYNNSSYIAKRDTTGNPPPEATINSNAYWQLVAKGIIDADVSDATVALTYESENREELQSGETTDTLFSKIKRWYSEFATVTFSGKYSDLSGTPGVVSKSADGLVQKSNGQINKVWKTDANGNPAWRDDANTQTITGIKGNAETAYRTGNVNLTPANIGAVATSKVLSTKEQINANTDTANVAGATAVKAMVSEINSNIQSIDEIYVDKEISWAAAFEEIARKHNAKYAIGILSYYTPTHVLLTPPPGSGFSHVALLVSGHQKWRFVIDADIINSKLYYSVFAGDAPGNWHTF